MDTQQTDRRLRELYEENAAPVDMARFSARLQKRLPPKRHRARRPLRVVGIALVSLALVAGLGIGILEAATHLGRQHIVVVITDQPGNAGSSSTQAQPGTTAAPLSGSTSGTLAGLGSLRLDFDPRPGVHLQAYLTQMPGSGAVTLMLQIDNHSDTPFSYAVGDFSLYVDGSSFKASAMVHQPSPDVVIPGGTSGLTGGFHWLLSRPTSTSTGLSYTSSDPGSRGFNRMVSAQQ